MKIDEVVEYGGPTYLRLIAGGYRVVNIFTGADGQQYARMTKN